MTGSLFTGNGLLQIALYFVVLFALVKPLGSYMLRVYEEDVWLQKPLGWLEGFFYKLCGTQRNEEMNWKQYAAATLMFSLGGFMLLYSKDESFAGLESGKESIVTRSDQMTGDLHTYVSLVCHTSENSR